MEQLDYIIAFTKMYKQYENQKYLKEAHCQFLMHKWNRSLITKDDFYVSNYISPICGFGSRSTGFIYYCQIEELEKLSLCATEEEKAVIDDLIAFWQIENDKERMRKEYPKHIQEWMPSDEFETDYYCAYPLYRLGGAYLDFERLIKRGICGLIEDVKKSPLLDTHEFVQASLISLESFLELVKLYRDDAKYINPEVYQTLNEIIEHEPRNMREAIQLIWLYVGMSEVRNYGRMDIILADFASCYESDYQCILEYFKVIQKRNTIFNGRIIIGGIDRKNTEKEDYIANIAIDVMRDDSHFTEPQLTLRCYQGMSEALLDNAMKCMQTGCSFPLLYNDEENIKNVMESFGVSYEVACDYLPFGCGEYVLNHKSIGSPNGLINLLKVLEGVLNKGQCRLSGKRITKFYVEQPQSFQELYDVVKKEIEHHIDILAEHEAFEYDYMNRHCGYLLVSLLYDKCLERGKSLLNGGIDYLGGTMETYGNINLAESLYAIYTLVFQEKKLTFQELQNAVNHNFEGYEEIRQLCLNVDKYGNDILEVDAFVNEMNQYIAQTNKSKAIKYGLSTYLIVIINNSANSFLGHCTAASYDGRRSQEALANAITPQAGAEKSGLTAALNSVSSLDVNNMAGAVYNLKVSHTTAHDHLDMIKTLIKTYFHKSGSQLMMSVVDNKELEDAMKHPEKYPHLIVRVGGFSARFIDLDVKVQREILSRALY